MKVSKKYIVGQRGPRCLSTNDGGLCEKKAGHHGYHSDGGYIWAKTAGEMARDAKDLRRELLNLRARIKLAKKILLTNRPPHVRIAEALGVLDDGVRR